DGRAGREPGRGRAVHRGRRPRADLDRPPPHLGPQPRGRALSEAAMREAPADAALQEAASYPLIQEVFVSRRGDPLFLSNADWLLIRKWRRAGLPLRIVMRGIADALDGHAHSWGRKRKVGSLAYCAAEADAARERWQRALSFDDETETSVTAALAGFASAPDRA